MDIKKKIFSIIYNPSINWILRNINYVLSPVLPKKVKIHPSGVLTVEVKNHNSFRLEANQTSYVARELFWKGSNYYEYTPLFIEVVKKVENFFDIGSSIGYYSVLAATVNEKIKVEAFEPSVGAMTYLSRNITLNNMSSRINVNLLALSDRIGQIEFFEVRNKKYPNTLNLSGEHNVGTKPYLKSNRTMIDSLTLDKFVEIKKIYNIDLIKLDTEGSEDIILRNGKEVIKRFKPIIICETLFNRIEAELEQIMLEFNYEFFNYKENQLYKVDSLKRTSDNAIRNCFFVHPSKKHLIEEFINFN